MAPPLPCTGPDVTSWLHPPDGSNQGAGTGPREAPSRRRRQSQPPGLYEGGETRDSPDFLKQNTAPRISPQSSRTLEPHSLLPRDPILPLSGAPTPAPGLSSPTLSTNLHFPSAIPTAPQVGPNSSSVFSPNPISKCSISNPGNPQPLQLLIHGYTLSDPASATDGPPSPAAPFTLG